MHKPGLKVFFDGGCRPNPGPIEVMAVVRGVPYHRAGLGSGTNNDAEWLALIHALTVAGSLGETDVILIGDAALVVNQAIGAWKCRGPTLRRHLTRYEELTGRFDRIRLRHVGRSHNLAGIALARLHEQR